MIQSFFMVGQQVLHLFIIVAIGYVLGKVKLIGGPASVGMSNLVMYVVSPCMLVVAFQRPLEADTFRNFCVALAAAAVIHLLNIAAAQTVVRDKDLQRQQALRFSTVFSNSGFMAYPLQTALLGTIGVFYGSAYVLIFNIAAWTYGLWLMGGKEGKLSWRPLVFNPGILGVAVAMTLYLLGITLPEIILTPVTWLSNLNTPLPMVVLGYQLSQADLRAVLRHGSMWVGTALRLLILPAAALVLCLIFRLDAPVLIATVVASSAPSAAILTMFAAKFDRDTALTSGIVAVQTLFSVITMPLIVGLAQYLVS
ncbi:MAG: AEC family transporter [Clostridiales bacterium]|nr:AEC family transporter [Candidatus Cacconaster stercorequi]